MVGESFAPLGAVGSTAVGHYQIDWARWMIAPAVSIGGAAEKPAANMRLPRRIERQAEAISMSAQDRIAQGRIAGAARNAVAPVSGGSPAPQRAIRGMRALPQASSAQNKSPTRAWIAVS